MKKDRLLAVKERNYFKSMGCFFFILGLAGFILMGSGIKKATAQSKIELRAATYFATTHQLYKSMEDFLRKVEERSGGRVKVNIFAGNTLLGAREIYDGVVKGVADIGMTMPVSGRVTTMASSRTLSWSTVRSTPNTDGTVPSVGNG